MFRIPIKPVLHGLLQSVLFRSIQHGFHLRVSKDPALYWCRHSDQTPPALTE